MELNSGSASQKPWGRIGRARLKNVVGSPRRNLPSLPDAPGEPRWPDVAFANVCSAYFVLP